MESSINPTSGIIKFYHSPYVTFILHSINFYYQLQRIKAFLLQRIRNSLLGEKKKEKKMHSDTGGCVPCQLRNMENKSSLNHACLSRSQQRNSLTFPETRRAAPCSAATLCSALPRIKFKWCHWSKSPPSSVCTTAQCDSH